MKIRYEFLTEKQTRERNFADAEVSDELGEAILEMERKEHNRNRAETRRHVSYSDDNDKRDSLADNSIDIENEIIAKLDHKRLYQAINQLLPQQQQLVYKIYFQNEKIVDIAKDESVTEGAIRNRLRKALNKLKKLLK